MRTIIFVIFLMSSISYGAKVEMTKKEVVEMAAHAVVKSGRANIIDGCVDLKSNKELIDCVVGQTLMDENISKLKDNESVNGIIDFGYWDASGDCALTVSVDTSHRKVTSIEAWICD